MIPTWPYSGGLKSHGEFLPILLWSRPYLGFPVFFLGPQIAIPPSVVAVCVDPFEIAFSLLSKTKREIKPEKCDVTNSSPLGLNAGV